MSWIVGIICIILVIVFWRIFVPLAAIAGLGLVGLYFYEDSQNKRRERERVQLQASLTAKLAAATVASRDSERRWLVQWTRDPASGQNVARSAEVQSDGDVCTLQVEQRINGSRLTGIYCPGFKIDAFADVEVKFENRSTSDPMQVSAFSGSSDIYISSNQFKHSGHLQYDEFLRRLTTGKNVALRIKFDGAGWHWVKFSLNEAQSALLAIRAVQPPPPASNSSTVNRSINSSKSTSSRGTDPNTSAIRLPDNAELDYTGNNWKCMRGFRRTGNECVAVQIPAFGELDYTGNGWKCKRGYARTGNECGPVQIPANGELDFTGNDWKCQRGFRRAGMECVPVGVAYAN